MRLPISVTVLGLIAACPVADDGDGPAREGEGEGEGGQPVDASGLVDRLTGLWAGPADSQTPLGDFVVMSMDHRVDDGVLFARGDLDANNAIRWWLWRDADDGAIRFENGGFFAGFFRSDGCHAVEAGADRYRFCADAGGCAHIDAHFEFPTADTLVLTVVVDGRPHVTWQADRVEERPAAPLVDSVGAAPTLPTVQVNATFPAVPGGADAWLVLTATRCGFTFSCSPSRSFRQPLTAGAVSTSFTMQEVHPGDYFAVLIVDSNGNFVTAPFPDGADRVSVPDQAVRVDAVDGAVVTLAATVTPP